MLELRGVAERHPHIGLCRYGQLLDARAEQMPGKGWSVETLRRSVPEPALLTRKTCDTIRRQISVGTARCPGAGAQITVCDDRTGRLASTNDRPSNRSEPVASTTLRTVGKMSTVSTMRSTTSPRCCSGTFMNSGTRGCRRRCAAVLDAGAAFAVARTMIGCDDDERPVVHADFAQPPDQITNQAVDISDLRKMSLMQRICICSAGARE